MIVAVLVTLLLHAAILINADWLGAPTQARIDDALQAAAATPHSEDQERPAEAGAVVYQNLRAPRSHTVDADPPSDSP